jgi:hypothetical protein
MPTPVTVAAEASVVQGDPGPDQHALDDQKAPGADMPGDVVRQPLPRGALLEQTPGDRVVSRNPQLSPGIRRGRSSSSRRRRQSLGRWQRRTPGSLWCGLRLLAIGGPRIDIPRQPQPRRRSQVRVTYGQAFALIALGVPQKQGSRGRQVRGEGENERGTVEQAGHGGSGRITDGPGSTRRLRPARCSADEALESMPRARRCR